MTIRLWQRKLIAALAMDLEIYDEKTFNLALQGSIEHCTKNLYMEEKEARAMLPKNLDELNKLKLEVQEAIHGGVQAFTNKKEYKAVLNLVERYFSGKSIDFAKENLALPPSNRGIGR